MKTKKAVLRSKVARRILSLFVLCALIPICLSTVVTIFHVSNQVNKQTGVRMKDAARAAGTIVLDRLLDLEEGLLSAAADVRGDPTRSQRVGSALGAKIGDRFTGLVIVRKSDKTTLFGETPVAPTLTDSEQRHLAMGRTLVVMQPGGDGARGITLVAAVDPTRLKNGILVGTVRSDFVWKATKASVLPPNAELCVLDDFKSMVSCDHVTPPELLERLEMQEAEGHEGKVEWSDASVDYIGGFWTTHLRPRFGVTSWTFVVSQRKTGLLAPVGGFIQSFLLVTLLVVLVVSLLSITLIRKSLIPLEQLRAATARIARREFDVPVDIKSGDEFEELAESFNSMMTRLRRQFGVLNTIGEIDRTILSTLDTDKIVATLLMRFQYVLPSDTLAVTLVEEEKKGGLRTFVRGQGLQIGDSTTTRALYDEEIDRLRSVTDTLLIAHGDDVPHYLSALAELGAAHFVVFPLFVQGKLSAMIALGFFAPPELSHEDLGAARQVADQVAIALSNARLLKQLDDLNWGTLTALARTIDAKSPWTAGHSERVTELATRIGEMLSVSEGEMESLRRGGLLHDIGKIGVPAGILDKADKLTADERTVMEEHVRLGARILEPISAYADVLPIVRQHHEWWDGSGYPDGLRGEAIDLRARIFAVADCFDSLSSDRPYRKSLGREGAIAVIWQQSGRQFDPRVVDAFLLVMTEEEKQANHRAEEDEADDDALEPERVSPEILTD